MKMPYKLTEASIGIQVLNLSCVASLSFLVFLHSYYKPLGEMTINWYLKCRVQSAKPLKIKIH